VVTFRRGSTTKLLFPGLDLLLGRADGCPAGMSRRFDIHVLFDVARRDEPARIIASPSSGLLAKPPETLSIIRCGACPGYEPVRTVLVVGERCNRIVSHDDATVTVDAWDGVVIRPEPAYGSLVFAGATG